MVTDEDHDGEGSTLENGDEEMESDQWQLETETDQCNKISCPGLKTLLQDLLRTVGLEYMPYLICFLKA